MVHQFNITIFNQNDFTLVILTKMTLHVHIVNTNKH